jgi:hypothetical protein
MGPYYYWELTGMYKLAQIYIEFGRDLLLGLIRLHKIFKDQGMGEHDIRNVFALVKHNELQNLQWKVEYLKNEINMLKDQKTKATNHLLVLDKRIDEFQGTLNMYKSSWAQKTGEMTFINQEPRMLQESSSYNTNNLYPVSYADPDTSSEVVVVVVTILS